MRPWYWYGGSRPVASGGTNQSEPLTAEAEEEKPRRTIWPLALGCLGAGSAAFIGWLLCRAPAAVLLLCLMPAAARAQETEITYTPLIVGDPDSGRENVRIINRLTLASPPKPIYPPPGRIFLEGTILTRPVDGCLRIINDCATGYTVGGHPSLTGRRCEFIQVGHYTTLRLSGSGALIDDPIVWLNAGPSDNDWCEVEGDDSNSPRHGVATGWHDIRRQNWVNFRRCIVTLPGYWEAERLVPFEAHADNSIVESCGEWNCGAVFYSTNIQSVNWRFNRIALNWVGGGRGSCCAADIRRGGNVVIDGLTLNDPHPTVFRVEKYSDNTARLVARNIEQDRFNPAAGLFPWLCVFDYDGPIIANPDSWVPIWSLEADGFVCNHADPTYDRSKIYRIPTALKSTKAQAQWSVKIRNLNK